MKFGFILSQKWDLVEVCRKESERYNFFISETKIEPEYLKAIKVTLRVDLLEKKISERLELRKYVNLNIPDYEGRFKEEDMFETIEYQNISYRLCNSGFDNLTLFLFKLLNSVKLNGAIHYFFLANNHQELRDFQEKNTLTDV